MTELSLAALVFVALHILPAVRARMDHRSDWRPSLYGAVLARLGPQARVDDRRLQKCARQHTSL